MKNRNADKKYILNQFRQIEVKRLFDKLDEINNRTVRSCKATPRNKSENEKRKLHWSPSKNGFRFMEIRR